MTLDTVQYTATAHASGGRDGASRSADGRLAVKRSSPGTPGSGPNPEQLFAAGWSACCIGAMKIKAGNMTVTLPADPAIDAEVDLGTTRGADGLVARLHVSLPGMPRAVAQSLLEAAHQGCPVSRATRGHIDVVMTLVSAGPVTDLARPCASGRPSRSELSRRFQGYPGGRSHHEACLHCLDRRHRRAVGVHRHGSNRETCRSISAEGGRHD